VRERGCFLRGMLSEAMAGIATVPDGSAEGKMRRLIAGKAWP